MLAHWASEQYKNSHPKPFVLKNKKEKLRTNAHMLSSCLHPRHLQQDRLRLTWTSKFKNSLAQWASNSKN